MRTQYGHVLCDHHSNYYYLLSGLCERTLLQPDPAALHQAVITLPIKDEKKPVQGLLQHQNFDTLLGQGGVRSSGAGQYMQTDNTGRQVIILYRVSQGKLNDPIFPFSFLMRLHLV